MIQNIHYIFDPSVNYNCPHNVTTSVVKENCARGTYDCSFKLADES